ncbi:hypothetical protein SDC9_159837 [bioreactor metagenome]|uniref:Uncharacterized protein n=1 Tax=bioreactor metagenome TaxID=1076179 RepID=A0A645FGN8_9ZZZZ
MIFFSETNVAVSIRWITGGDGMVISDHAVSNPSADASILILSPIFGRTVERKMLILAV